MYKSMLVLVLFFIALIECVSKEMPVDQCPNKKMSIGAIRQRRHVVFQNGSALSLTASMVKSFMTHVPSGWFSIVEMDLVYPLPDSNFTNRHFRKKLHHRQKREFWNRIQNALDFNNHNGRACVLRSICEAKLYLASPGKSLVHDILRAIFTAPTHDPEFIAEMGDSYDELLDPSFCEQIIDCPFSLLKMLLEFKKQKYY